MKTKFFCLFLLAMIVVSCAPPMRVHFFPGHRYYPPTSVSSVDVLRHDPRRPHEAFAEIVYEPPAGMSRWDAERYMRERAASIGADALVVEVDNVFRESVWVGPYRTTRRIYRTRVLVGIAIRYH